jgi:hypothetical protein
VFVDKCIQRNNVNVYFIFKLSKLQQHSPPKHEPPFGLPNDALQKWSHCSGEVGQKFDAKHNFPFAPETIISITLEIIYKIVFIRLCFLKQKHIPFSILDSILPSKCFNKKHNNEYEAIKIEFYN